MDHLDTVDILLGENNPREAQLAIRVFKNWDDRIIWIYLKSCPESGKE